MKRQSLKLDFALALSLLVLVAIDQLAKALARNFLQPQNYLQFGFFQLANISNTGSAFGIFRGSSGFLVLLAIFAAAAIVFSYRRLDKFERVAAVLVAAGVAGNTVDRLLRGYVTDFIYFKPWPAFNFADIFLFLGAGLIIYRLTRKRIIVKGRNK